MIPMVELRHARPALEMPTDFCIGCVCPYVPGVSINELSKFEARKRNRNERQLKCFQTQGYYT